jgi:hypothetical protein
MLPDFLEKNIFFAYRKNEAMKNEAICMLNVGGTGVWANLNKVVFIKTSEAFEGCHAASQYIHALYTVLISLISYVRPYMHLT